jgi:hypothetical protein
MLGIVQVPNIYSRLRWCPALSGGAGYLLFIANLCDRLHHAAVTACSHQADSRKDGKRKSGKMVAGKTVCKRF